MVMSMDHIKNSFLIGNIILYLRFNQLKMRIIALGRLKAFGEKHPGVWLSIKAWYRLASDKAVAWHKPQDVVSTFGVGRVDILKNNRVCINIAGNQLRIVLKVEYGRGIAFVRWIGWHKEYDTLGDRIHWL